MKGMPLPFDFEGKGELDLDLVVKRDTGFGRDSAISSTWGEKLFKKDCFFNCFVEPKSVLDSARIPSRPTSTSTLSTSFGGGVGAACTDTAGVAAVSDTDLYHKWRQDSTTATSSNAGADSEIPLVPPSVEIVGGGGTTEECAMEDWETVLSEPIPGSSGQELSMFRLIMGDVGPSVDGVNKVLQISGGPSPPEVEFCGAFGALDQAFGGDSVGQFGTGSMPANPALVQCSSFPNNRFTTEKIDTLGSNPSFNLLGDSKLPNSHNSISTSVSNNLGAFFNPQLLVNQHQAHHTQNPSFFLPAQQHQHNLLVPPQMKRHNSSGATSGVAHETGGQIPKGSFLDTGQELFLGRQQLAYHHPQVLPRYLHQRPLATIGQDLILNMGGDETGHCDQQQQAIIDQLYKASELVQTGNFSLAQGILARLNHQLSSFISPFQRAALYFKEALELVLHGNNLNPSTTAQLPFSLIFQIGAHKSFSEISPLTHFTSCTCNQAVLEVLEGFDRVHIVDFEIGYGGQWASLMQELALRSGGAQSLKITALVSPLNRDRLEFCLIQENLNLFAKEINIEFEFEVMNIDLLNSSSWCMPFHVSENEAFAVNLPLSSFASFKLPLPSVLHFVKQLSPKILVSVDRGCDRTDLPLANHIINALQSYSNLLESLDATNMKMDALQKIEKFLLQPEIKKIVMGRFRSPEKILHWRSHFSSYGFTPVPFSNFTESQAECVVKRTPVRGFQVEKRQSSLVLYWQNKELASVSAWRC